MGVRDDKPRIMIVGGSEGSRSDLLNKVNKAGIPEGVPVVLMQSVESNSTDFLTGCLNFTTFIERVQDIITREDGNEYCLIYFDVSNLTYINSAFGYETGDGILKIMGQTAMETTKEDEPVARIADDKFVALYNVKNSLHGPYNGNTAQLIEKRVDDYMVEMGFRHHVEINAGVYHITPEAAKTIAAQHMIDYAVAANKEAKKNKTKKVMVFNEAMIDKLKRQNTIINALDDALADEEIKLWYQPQVDCRNSTVVGAEVLCRWNSKLFGFLSPAEFIPIFENNGQICKLDQYIWEKACLQLATWIRERGKYVPLSVNVSRRDIQDLDVGKILAQLIEKYELSPDMLRIEITESAYMDKPEQLVGFVNKLKKMGFTVEMDDFGSGYSSLNMLQEVPVDILKLDLKFLSTSDGGTHGAGSIVSSVIRMAKGIALGVIAEGVETEEQCASLHNMGCTVIQGYYYAKPMPVEEFEEYVITHKIGHVGADENSDDIGHLHDLLNHGSESSYIFDHYIGSGAIVELTGDKVEVLKINKKFMDSMGDFDRNALEHVSDGLFLISEEERAKALNSLKNAVKYGQSEIELYIPSTRRWIRSMNRLMFSGPVSNYLFVEITNTTDKHVLGEHFTSYIKKAEETLSVIPSGVFKYEADGNQEFSYVSRSMLWQLGYKTREEFLDKFNNRFPDMVYKEDRDRVLREIDNQITEDNHLDYCEYRIEMADGTLKWFSDYGHAITDENGKKWYYVVIFDADAARNAKLASAFRLKELEILADSTGISTFEYNPKTDQIELRYIDPALGGWNQIKIADFSQIINDADVFAPESAVRIKKLMSEACNSDETFVLHIEYNMLKTGFKRYRCNCGSVFDENGKVERVVGIIME